MIQDAHIIWVDMKMRRCEDGLWRWKYEDGKMGRFEDKEKKKDMKIDNEMRKYENEKMISIDMKIKI